ncbi:MAG: hypothetical protein ABIA59_01475 [Candidatus Latescibacterota bacterium]
MRQIFFLLGMGLLVLGLSSYFGGIPIPVDFSSSLIAVGTADFRLDIVLIIFGTLLILLSLAMTKSRA